MFCGKYGKPLLARCSHCSEEKRGACHNRYGAPWLEVGIAIAWLLTMIGVMAWYFASRL